MKKTLGTALAIAAIAFSQAVACDYPTDRPEIVDAASATLEEMLAKDEEVRTFITAMDEYLTCLEGDIEALASVEDLSQEDRANRESVMNKMYNAAVEEMYLVRDLHNAQVRVWKDLHPD